MPKYFSFIGIFILACFTIIQQARGSTIVSDTMITTQKNLFFKASDPFIKYMGRVDFSNPDRPRFWNPGVYMSLNFKGSTCKVIIEDQMNYGVMHNYLEIVIDGKPRRIRLNQLIDTIEVARGLSNGPHHLLICKDTESNIGYVGIAGVICEQLLPQTTKNRLIECFGDSITCGASSDLSGNPCGVGRWEDQHNCYLSYGPRLARKLNADWVITAVSGIGLMHSCCDLKITLPEVFDKLALSMDSIKWNFKTYQPGLVTICLGQNDGIQDLDSFCTRYVDFVSKLRIHYPSAKVLLLNSPMADKSLSEWLQKALLQVEKKLIGKGIRGVYHYFFKNQYNKGCDSHPSTDQHQEIAEELLPFVQKIMNWDV